jgi:hypothetical protein
VVAEDDEVFSFGLYGSGRLDPKRKMFKADPVVHPSLSHKKIEVIACGKDFTIFSTQQHQTYGFGTNANGQLGLGTLKQTRAIENEPQLIEGMSGKEVREIVCGAYHAFARTDKELFTWGSNRFGQLAQGVKDKLLQNPTKVEGLDEFRILSMAAGAYHTIAIVGPKTPPEPERGVDPKTAGISVLSVGYNNSGQLGLAPAPQPVCRYRFRKITALSNGLGVQSVGCGWFHTVVATAKGHMYAFGCNTNGQLGLGDIKNRAAPERVFGFKDVPQSLMQFEYETIWECQRDEKDRILTPVPGKIRVRTGFAAVGTEKDLTNVLERGDQVRIGTELFRVHPTAFRSEHDLPLDRLVAGVTDTQRTMYMLSDEQKVRDRGKAKERAARIRLHDREAKEAEEAKGAKEAEEDEAKKEPKSEAKAEAKGEKEVEGKEAESKESKAVGEAEAKGGEAEIETEGKEFQKISLFDEETARQEAYAEAKKAAPSAESRQAMAYDWEKAEAESAGGGSYELNVGGINIVTHEVKSEAEKGVITTKDTYEVC